MSLADLSMSYLRAANFTRARMWHTVLKRATCKNALFFDADLRGADILGAEMLGAVFDGARTDGLQNIRWATFRWFLSPLGGRPSYIPFPGCEVLEESAMGRYTRQENAGRVSRNMREKT